MVTAKPKKGASSGTPAHTTIVVGLDFGTTYPGIAWARSNNPDHIRIISDWEGEQNSQRFSQAPSQEKAPSILSYDAKGQVSSWGYGFEPPKEPVKWFKLLLLDENDLPSELASSDEIKQVRMLLQKHNKEPVEAIGNYLDFFWHHGFTKMLETLVPSILPRCDLEIVATLPAIWPPYAQVRMREAIERAGILDKQRFRKTSMCFVSEPEAAALASIHDLVADNDIKEGDHFVVCDAGGGTADLITYTITSKQPMVVKESVCGQGDLCGAVLLDKAFMNVLRQKIPSELWNTATPEIIHSYIKSQWENGIKRNFSGGESPGMMLPFPGTKDMIEINADELRDIFSPVVNRISALVREQIDAVNRTYNVTPKAVFVVGGLGKSAYLFRCLQREFKDIRIARDSGDRPWTAVCRGAVIKGLSKCDIPNALKADVSSRVSRAHYGTLVCLEDWKEGEDDPRDREWSDARNDYIVADQIEWFLEMGASLEQGATIQTYYQDFLRPEKTIEIHLVYSTAPSPSSRCDETIKDVCRITWAKIPEFRSLRIKTNPDGTVCRTLSYDIKTTVIGSTIDFAVYYRGERVASQNVAVDFGQSVAPEALMQPSIERTPTIANTPSVDDDHPMSGQFPSSGDESSSEYMEY